MPKNRAAMIAKIEQDSKTLAANDATKISIIELESKKEVAKKNKTIKVLRRSLKSFESM